MRVDGYGDSPELSAALLALIREGRKRAGTSLLWAIEAEAAEIPREGQIEIVIDHRHEPVFVTRITRVEVLPYNEVTAEYAAIEGEGDSSLDYWRKAHWAFFSRECQRIGREPAETMPVVCSVFEVLDVLPHHEGQHAQTAAAPRSTTPTLGDRLPLRRDQTVLRALRASDLERFHAYRSDEILARYQGWTPMSRDEALAFLHATCTVTDLIAGDWIQLGIADAKADELLGDLGLFLAHDGQWAELGFTLERQSQGQGHASRAVRLAIELVLAASSVGEIRAVTDVRNLASIKVLDRTGFRFAARQQAVFKGEACEELVYLLRRAGG